MAKAFSIARSWTCEPDLQDRKIVVGKINRKGNVIDGQKISAFEVTYNTGFVDTDGNEIFEGDYLSGISGRVKGEWLVQWDDEDEDFFLMKEDYSDPDAPRGYFQPLTKYRAQRRRITGNIYKKRVEQEVW